MSRFLSDFSISFVVNSSSKASVILATFFLYRFKKTRIRHFLNKLFSLFLIYERNVQNETHKTKVIENRKVYE